MCERNGTANTYNKYLLMLTYFFLFSTSINEHYNAHKRYIFFYSPGFIAQKTYFEFSQFSKIGNLIIVVIAHPSFSICIHVTIQYLKRKRGIKLNHTPAIKRRFREIVDYISTWKRKSIF